MKPKLQFSHLIAFVVVLILIPYTQSYAIQLDQTKQQPEFHLLNDELENEFEWLRAETLVYSVSKYPEELFQIPGAVYKIKSDDIRRSGALCIPDILRQSPGTHVTLFNTSDWTVAVRGFTAELVNKLLVLMDGRTLYTPIFSGVFWNTVDTIIEDIDAIEVIRGPGGTIWGANAVNGVINIISKKVQDTQGMFVSYNASANQVETNLRYGGTFDSQRYYRIWMKAFQKEYNNIQSGNLPDQNNWQSFRGGFRFDWDHADTFMMLEASLAEDNIMEGSSYDARIRERYIMSKIEKNFTNESSIQFSAYYNHMVRNMMLYEVEKEDRYDIDSQYTHYFNPYNRLTLGAGYRYICDNINPDKIFSFNRTSWSRSVTSGFIQHKWSLVPDYIIIKVGSKFEYNEFTGFEKQPGFKVLWLPSKGHAIWGSVSQAVHTPARIDLNADMQTQASWKKGNPDLESEKLTAYEIGYRTTAIKDIYIDISTFYNIYKKLRRMVNENDYVIIPDNQMDGETYGGELVFNWDVLMDTTYIHKWTLSNSWSFIRMNIHQLDKKFSNTEELNEGNYPRNMVSCFSKMDITDCLQLDIALHYIEALSAFEAPTYIKTDFHLSYQLSDNIQCQLIGQNIQDPAHPEFFNFESKRLIFGKLVFQY